MLLHLKPKLWIVSPAGQPQHRDGGPSSLAGGPRKNGGPSASAGGPRNSATPSTTGGCHTHNRLPNFSGGARYCSFIFAQPDAFIAASYSQAKAPSGSRPEPSKRYANEVWRFETPPDESNPSPGTPKSSPPLRAESPHNREWSGTYSPDASPNPHDRLLSLAGLRAPAPHLTMEGKATERTTCCRHRCPPLRRWARGWPRNTK